MSKYTVVVADAKRARFFSLQDSLTPEIESSPRLVEREVLANPRNLQNEAKRLSSPNSGRNRVSSGASYAFDDHRGKRDLDGLRKFSTLIAKEALKQTRKEDAHSLVLVAGKRTLGMLRESLSAIKTNGLGIHECDRDLAGDTPAKIHELLAKMELVPPEKKPARKIVRK